MIKTNMNENWSDENNEIYKSSFGAELFNFYTQKRIHVEETFYFSARYYVIRKMIDAMIEAEKEIIQGNKNGKQIQS